MPITSEKVKLEFTEKSQSVWNNYPIKSLKKIPILKRFFKRKTVDVYLSMHLSESLNLGGSVFVMTFNSKSDSKQYKVSISTDTELNMFYEELSETELQIYNKELYDYLMNQWKGPPYIHDGLDKLEFPKM